jgi:hypothetical protein
VRYTGRDQVSSSASGVAKANSVVGSNMLEFSIREVLNRTAAPHAAGAGVIENYPEASERSNRQPSRRSGGGHPPHRVRRALSSAMIHENPPKSFSALGCRIAALRISSPMYQERGQRVVELPVLRSGDPRRAPDGARSRRPPLLAPNDRCGIASTASCSQNRSDAHQPPISIRNRQVLKDAGQPGRRRANSNDVMRFERREYFVRDPD